MDQQELDRWIEELDEKVTAAEGGDRNWKEVWGDIRGIQQEFRSTWYPMKSDKDSAWDRFQEIVNRMKAYQTQELKRREEEQEQRGNEWTSKVEISTRHKEDIVSHAESGRPASGLEEFLAAPVLLPLEAAVNALTLGQGSSLFDRREALKYWSQRIQEAWDLFGERKDDMLGRDRTEVYDQLKELQAQCDEAWARFRGTQAQAQEAREEEREEWRERMKAKRERLQALLEKNEGVIERLEEQIEDLEEKISAARSEDWADRARGWVEEKHGVIRDIESTNEELEEKIKEIDEQLEQ